MTEYLAKGEYKGSLGLAQYLDVTRRFDPLQQLPIKPLTVQKITRPDFFRPIKIIDLLIQLLT